jgi:16S rRNA (guanine527-N7)-methyltransferase
MQDNFPPSSLQMAELLNVSRETLDRLEIFEKLLRRWQKTINLVGTSTLNDIWRRHFLDCGQICNLTPLHMKNVVDIGSGAGFPGLVVSIISGCSTTLIEADKRKAAFLREASRATFSNASVLAERAENIKASPADVVTIRALAPIARLLELSEPWVLPGGECYFLKGASVEDELTDAKHFWDIKYELFPSLSSPEGTIVCVKEFNRVC